MPREVAGIKFKGEKLRLIEGMYMDGNPVLFLLTEDDENYATLSVNLPNFTQYLKEKEFFIKVWSENEPISDFLRESKLFNDTKKRVPVGFSTAEIWKLLV